MKLAGRIYRFFDLKSVRNRADRARLNYLKRGSLLIRKIAVRSIRRGKGSAPKGKPPIAHSDKLKGNILADVDAGRMVGVIGPVAVGEDRTAAALEHGGTVTIPTAHGPVKATYSGNPFMGPALKVGTPTLGTIWDDAVR